LTFPTASGEEVTRRYTVPRAFYDRVAQGQPIPVRYLPSAPAISEVEPGAVSGSARSMTVLALALVVLAVVCFLVAVRALGSQRRAARDGEKRTARIVQHVAHGSRKARHFFWAEWLDAHGGTGRTAANSVARLPAVDSSVTVYIDPKAGRGWWEGDF